MGDLELSILYILYDSIVIVFKKYSDNNITSYNTYGNLIEEKFIMTKCIINNNHFQVVYEKHKKPDHIKLIKENKLESIIKKIL